MPVPREDCPHHGDGPTPDNGRKTKYTPDLAGRILMRLMDGEMLRGICADDDIPVAPSTVLEWVKDDREGFAERYARARHIQADVLAEEIIAISDGEMNDAREDSHVVIQRDKLRAHNRKWLLKQMHPRKYSTKFQHTHRGDAEGPPVRIVLPDNGRGPKPSNALRVRRSTASVSTSPTTQKIMLPGTYIRSW